MPADAVRVIFGEDAAVPDSPLLGAAGPFRASIAKPAPQDRLQQFEAHMASMAAMLQSMQATYEELKRLAAPQPGQAALAQLRLQNSSAAAPPPTDGPAQQSNIDACLKYVEAHGPGAPMPAVLAGPWPGTGAAPLKPIHPKDVDKPDK